jgi:DNA-binding transcriptional LysR family regulator
MNLRQLELFVAITETGSFSGGAASASLTQSTVSQHIAALESEVGLRLLDRTGHGVQLTRAGELFLQHACRVLAECTALQQAMAGFSGLQHACLTIGASNIPANYLVPAMLPRLAAEHPGVALTMQTGDSRAMLDSLLNDAVELAVVGSRTNDRGLVFLPLAKDVLVLAVNPRHPWSRCTAITLDDLVKNPIIVRENGSGSDQALRQALQHAGVDPSQLQVAVRLGSNEAIRQALLKGFGAAFLSEIAIRQDLTRGELVRVAVLDFDVPRQFWLARRSQRTLSPAARVFSELMIDSLAGADCDSFFTSDNR